jgi:glutaredoxin 3
MIDLSGGRTVPQIFINDQAIGGYNDIAALDANGELDSLLDQAPPTD